jgi:hypothetical protein
MENLFIPKHLSALLSKRGYDTSSSIAYYNERGLLVFKPKEYSLSTKDTPAYLYQEAVRLINQRAINKKMHGSILLSYDGILNNDILNKAIFERVIYFL